MSNKANKSNKAFAARQPRKPATPPAKPTGKEQAEGQRGASGQAEAHAGDLQNQSTSPRNANGNTLAELRSRHADLQRISAELRIKLAELRPRIEQLDTMQRPASTAQLAAIVRSTSDAVFTKALDGRITSWNGGAERIYGWSAAEVVGKDVAILMPPDLAHQGNEVIERIVRGEEIAGLETVRVCKDGTLLNVSLTCSAIRGPADEVTAVSVIARDITAAKRTEDELRRANGALRRANEDLQLLSYAASHDLQEPLRMVSNYAQLLAATHGATLPERGREYLEWIVKGSLQLDELLRALKRYWSIERGKTESSPVDSGRVLTSALAHLKQAIEQSAAVITSDELPVVLAHETPLLELFQNLLGNALKYHRPGVPPRIHVAARALEGADELAVIDDGIGVPPHQREEIFKPFKRLHGNDVPGTGMGLAICSLIVERLGGRIWVEAREQGSAFKFTLPCAPR